jgi:hypothetical protein
MSEGLMTFPKMLKPKSHELPRNLSQWKMACAAGRARSAKLCWLFSRNVNVEPPSTQLSDGNYYLMSSISDGLHSTSAKMGPLIQNDRFVSTGARAGPASASEVKPVACLTMSFMRM